MNCSIDGNKYQASIRAYIQANRQQILEDLKTLVRVRSDRGEAQPGMPFGPGPAAGLEAAAKMLESYGIAVKSSPGSGYAVASSGEGEETLGIFCHCDTVGVNGDWLYTSAFEPVEKDGVLIGRGVKDDKGGVINALHALRALQAAGFTPKHRLEIILGSNEETGMKDMEYFAAAETMPAFSLVPDCEFPICRAEKSYCEYTAKASESFANITDFYSGPGRGSVCAEIAVTLKNTPALKAELEAAAADISDADFEDAGNSLILHAHGVAIHACQPLEGKQAGSAATAVLLKCPSLGEHDLKLIRQMDTIFNGVCGEPFGLEYYDKDFRDTTFAVTGVYVENGRPCFVGAPHYSPRQNIEELRPEMEKTFTEMGWSFELYDTDTGFIPDDKNSAVIEKLNSVFVALRGGQEKQLYVTRSGTYARKLKNAFATGIEVPVTKVPEHFPAGHGRVHQPDECINIEGLMDGIEMTAMMLIELDSAV